MKKKCQVVMLPTEKESNIHSYIYRLGLIDKPKKIYQMHGNNQICYAQHLYIISDDEIKEGDFYINRFNQIYQASDINLTSQEEWNTCKKIVATTDKSLITNKGLDSFSGKPDLLPQIPESFIKAYIKAYNEGNPITEVDLECYFTHETGYDKFLSIKTRLDNTVIIHQSKMYSRDEVIKLLHSVIKDCDEDGLQDHYNGDYENLSNWISKNL